MAPEPAPEERHIAQKPVDPKRAERTAELAALRCTQQEPPGRSESTRSGYPGVPGPLRVAVPAKRDTRVSPRAQPMSSAKCAFLLGLMGLIERAG